MFIASRRKKREEAQERKNNPPAAALDSKGRRFSSTVDDEDIWDESDEDYLRDVGMNFLIAGRDTTACLLTWTFYRLHSHNDVQQRVVQEVDHVLGSTDPTHDNVKGLQYLRAVLSEVLRLHPSVPNDSKIAVKADILPDGTPIPAGSIVSYQPYVFGRLSTLWDEPLNFNPDRWLSMKDPPSQFKFISFNAGPRLCLGKDMAYFEAEMLASMILQRYRLKVVPGHKDTANISIIIQMKYGLPVTVERRAPPSLFK